MSLTHRNNFLPLVASEALFVASSVPYFSHNCPLLTRDYYNKSRNNAIILSIRVANSISSIINLRLFQKFICTVLVILATRVITIISLSKSYLTGYQYVIKYLVNKGHKHLTIYQLKNYTMHL